MNIQRKEQELLLALFPATKGVGFAVFEGSEMLVDWGVIYARGERKNAQCLRRIRDQIAFYRPEIMVIGGRTRSRRAKRIGKLIDAISDVALKESIATSFLSRVDVQDCFLHRRVRSKREIAETIARDFPELAPRLPPLRRIWMSEDARMSIFDAVALGVTFFHKGLQKRRAA